MPTTGSADRDGQVLEPVAATDTPDLPPRRRALLMDEQSDEGLIARFLLATVTARAPPTRPTCATSGPGAPRPASGCWMCTAVTSRPTCASWSKPAEVAPPWPGGWPP
jgi:hypothetical protein